MVKNLPVNAGDVKDTHLIARSGRFLRGGQGNPLQYSCLGNPMDREVWQVTVRAVRHELDSRTGLSEHACSISLYTRTTSPLSVLLSIDIKVVSTSWWKNTF